MKLRNAYISLGLACIGVATFSSSAYSLRAREVFTCQNRNGTATLNSRLQIIDRGWFIDSYELTTMFRPEFVIRPARPFFVPGFEREIRVTETAPFVQESASAYGRFSASRLTISNRGPRYSRASGNLQEGALCDPPPSDPNSAGGGTGGGGTGGGCISYDAYGYCSSYSLVVPSSVVTQGTIGLNDPDIPKVKPLEAKELEVQVGEWQGQSWKPQDQN